MTTNSCYEMKIFVQQMHKDLFSSLLTELGISNFILDSVDCDLEAEYNPADSRQNQYESLLSQSESPIVIYSDNKEYLEDVQKALEHVLPSLQIPIAENMFAISEVDDSWRESWKNSFKPVFVKNVFAIIPPWENPNNFTQKFKITIDPGMAFGTGQHETTRLCLEAMLLMQKEPFQKTVSDGAAQARLDAVYTSVHEKTEQQQQRSMRPFFEKVLDVGTGSGILAIAAHLLGAKEIIGIDLDPDCIPIAIENAAANGISDIQFSHNSCDQILRNAEFDLVLANIQSTPLKSILPEIKRLVAQDGQIILSGILASERDEFVDFAKGLGLIFKSSQTMNDWCSIQFVR